MSTLTRSKSYLKHLSKEAVDSDVVSRKSTNDDKPSPFEFDKFLPWICLQFEVLVEVTVMKTALEKHTFRQKSSNNSKMKMSSQVLASKQAKSINTQYSDTNLGDSIQITAYYDTSGYLAEITIDKSPNLISGKIIKSINICLPFHPALFKLSIKCGLSSKLIYEIAKMLPHSNITDICLDGCYIPEGNYFILLDYISHLKVLSLKRCRINDMACKEIAKRIDLGEAGSTLSVLDLGINLINDRGAWYIADVLRRNRSLLHLNLSSNRITDSGLMYITNHLKEFQMNQEEILGRKKRRYEFLQRVGIGDDMAITANQGAQVHFRSQEVKSKLAKKKKQSVVENTSVTAVTATKEKFIDVFDDANIVIRDGNMYCVGNFTLCSLNLAYNELDYFSAKRLLEVLKYQRPIIPGSLRTGLIRLVLDGNLIPESCDEFHEILKLLNPAFSSRKQSQRSVRSRSTVTR